MRVPSSRKQNDTALSEVIGFVLILGLIGIVASLYLTYGVPAQGREDEITHMNVIKDEFIGYKLSLDSLFTNKQVGLTMSDSFTLGTKGVFTEGMMSIVPVMNPASSGGIIAINQRTATPETLTLSSRSFILNNTVKYSTDLPATAKNTPGHIYVNLSNIQSSDLSANGNFGATVNTTSWVAYVNFTPETSFYQNYFMPTNPQAACVPAQNQNGTAISVWSNGNYGCLVPMNAYAYNGTDITVTVKKGGIITMQNYPVYRNIRAGTTYTIDLMDESYGLKSATVPPVTVGITRDKPLGSITATGNISYDYAETNPYTVSPIPLGAVEYRSQNNYWINQNYYYQLGGVFLSQTDGNTSYKLPPEITFSYNNVSNIDTSKNIVTVNINALTIDPNNRGVVGGNSPVQLKSRLTNITPLPYAYTPNSANTKWIRIGVNTPDPQAQAMWKNYFNYIATVAGVPNFQVNQSGTEVFIRIRGLCDDDVSTCPSPDINVIASQAFYSETIHGIGGTMQ
ncbi:hypothetical protein [Methanoregula sp.]|uniref:hypothetical protein n=1 Tax=Methanoregula sp. TaxID=2052170 RepID=UPI0035624174